MKHLILAIVALLTAYSCSTDKKEVTETVSQQEIDSILVAYICGNPDFNKAMNCEKMAKIRDMNLKNDYSSVFFPAFIDTFIVDKEVVERIKPLLKKIRPAIDSFNIDARMYVTVKLKDSIESHICLGLWNKQRMFNGEPVILENELVYLLRMYTGYYNWFDKNTLEFDGYFRELQDTSFVREPIDTSFYRKFMERKDSIMASIKPYKRKIHKNVIPIEANMKGGKPDKTSNKPRRKKF
jgi:hypothetical protein